MYSATIYVDHYLNVENVANQIEMQGLRVSYATKEINDYYDTLNNIKRYASLFAGAIVLLSIAILSQSTINTIRKREKTIGVMKAFGYRVHKIFSFIFVEIIIYMILGDLFAFAFLIISKQHMNKIFQGIFNGEIEWNVRLSLLSFTFTNIIILVISLIRPFLKMRSTDPINVLKSE